MKKQKTIMILGGGFLQIPAVQQAKRMGLKVIVLDWGKSAPAFKYADQSEVISTTDIDAVVDCAMKNGIDAITTMGSDVCVPTIGAVNERLGLSGYKFEAANIVTNKHLFRNFLRKNDLPSPNFKGVSTLKDAIQCYRSLKKPLLIKPTDSSGSKGIFKIESLEDLRTTYSKSRKHSRSGVLCLEEFISGEEVSGDALFIDGKIRFFQMKNKYLNDCFVPYQHTVPSKLSKRDQKLIKDLLEEILRKLEIHATPLNFDIMMSDKGPVVLECGLRLGGNYLPLLLEVSTGINSIECAINMALGEQVFIEDHSVSPAGVRMLSSSKSGYIESFNTKFGKRNDVKVLYTMIHLKPGDFVKPFSEGSNAVGAVIVSGSELREVELALASIENEFNLKVKEEDGITKNSIG